MTLINKKYVAYRFARGLQTYDQHAYVQKWMAKRLCEVLRQFHPTCRFKKIFEIGAGTGLLTREMLRVFSVDEYIANDLISDSKLYVHNIQGVTRFVSGAAEEIPFPQKLDGVVANAVFQWIEDIPLIITKIASTLNDRGILGFTTFGPDNLKEIQTITDEKLMYIKIEEWNTLLQEEFEILHSEEITKVYRFKRAYDVLKHLKLTGTNGLKQVKWTPSDFRLFEQLYIKHFSDGNQVTLTYHPIIICARKK